MALREIQHALERLQSLEQIAGYICMTPNGVPIRTTFDEEYTKTLVTQLQPFLERLKRTSNHLGLKDLVELRLKTRKLEYLLRTDHSCTLIVVQRQEKHSHRTEE